jgi:predicted secreted protein
MFYIQMTKVPEFVAQAVAEHESVTLVPAYSPDRVRVAGPHDKRLFEIAEALGAFPPDGCKWPGDQP